MTTKNVRMYRKIGGVDGSAEEKLFTFQDADANHFSTPGVTASLQGFQSLTNMTGAGGISIDIDGTEYVIPLLSV